MYISTNLVDLFGVLFSVNILTYTVKGFKPSYPKIVYCTLLLSLFVLCFYFGAKSIFPRRGNFSMKTFSLWIMLSMQLLSPVLTLTVELLGLKKSAVGANIIVKVHKLVCSLGYQGCFGLAEKQKIKTQIFIVIFCFTIILYLLIMLYPYDTIGLKNSPILFRGTICVLFDVINQIHQTNFLRSMQLYSVFLKNTIKSSRFWSLNDTAKVKKLETIRTTQSLLSKALVLFNSKYYVSLLLLSIKTTVAVASVFSDFLVEKIFLSFVLPKSDEDRTIESSSYVDMVWSTYQIIFLFYTCHIHSSVTMEVNQMASVVHDVLTSGKVDGIADELLDFSIEILHTDFHFSVFGFFKVDYTLMFRVLSCIVSYIVILVQFQFQTSSRFHSSSGSLLSQLLAYVDSKNN